MSDELKLNAAFCVFADAQPFIPENLKEYLTEERFLAMSRRGDAPVFCRLLNQRSVAVFKRQEISNYWHDKWSVTHPGCCKSLRRAGFPQPQADATAKHEHAKADRRKARHKELRQEHKTKKKDASNAR